MQVGGDKTSVLKCEEKLRHLQQTSSSRISRRQPLSNAHLDAEKLNEKIATGLDCDIDLAESYASHQQVVSFIWAVIRSIVPGDLLGDSTVWRALRLNIAKFVALQKFETFNLIQCLHGLEISERPFLSQVKISACRCYKFWDNIRNCNCAKEGGNRFSKAKLSLHHRLFRHWIYWLFSSMIVPIIRRCFYVTERQFEKLQTYYYPKSVWRKLTDNAVSFLKEQNYRQLSDASCLSIINRRKFGFSRVRFLPRKNKMRILANTKAPCEIQIHAQCKRSFFVKSVNSALKELHAVLRRIKNENPQALGSSVFGYDEVYQKLHQFLQQIKGGRLMIPSVYIVVGDVAKAFDTINQDNLVKIMKDIIEKDKYILRSCTQVVTTKSRARTFHEQVAYDHGSWSNDVLKFEVASRIRSSSSVVIDQVYFSFWLFGFAHIFVLTFILQSSLHCIDSYSVLH